MQTSFAFRESRFKLSPLALASAPSSFNQLYFSESDMIRYQDPSRSLRAILEELRAACQASAGALAVFDRDHRRYVFRAAFGLQCSETALRNLTWWRDRLQPSSDGRRHALFAVSASELQARGDLAFERKLGFVSLCFVPLTVKQRMLGAVLLGNRQPGLDFNGRDLKRLAAAARVAGYELERLGLYWEFQSIFLNTVRSLAAAIEAKDPYTRGHSERVTDYSLKLAQVLGWNEERVSELRMAAILHDIGKIGVPEAILLKPGRLTAEEYAVIQKHPRDGVTIVGEIPQLQPSLPGILCHHERYNGRGYPQGLAGPDIPAFGRLIAVADAYDAMTADRPYRQSLPAETALQELKNQRGQQFDPEMIDAFFEACSMGKIKVG